MPKFMIEIDLGNDAMQTGSDIAAQLDYIANRLRKEVGRSDLGAPRAVFSGSLRDDNGNRVGFFSTQMDTK